MSTKLTRAMYKHEANDISQATTSGLVASTREKFEYIKSPLETEQRDMHECYLQISLKYAEVKARRKELVMKLK